MKLVITSFALASAGLLASASPMRVVVVESGSTGMLIKPAAETHNPSFTNVVPDPAGPHGLKPCAGARMRQKAGSMVAAFRIALGFSSHDAKAPDVQALPFLTPGPALVGANLEANAKTPGGDLVHVVEIDGPIPVKAVPSFPEGHVHAHHAHHRFHKHGGERLSFLMRVHYALMSLGPWEGRAVAFVLGCGIGVLLRMAWVLTVLLVRAIRSPSSEHDEYIVLESELDAEEIFVAPPTYTYPVEKAEAAPAPAAEEAK